MRSGLIPLSQADGAAVREYLFERQMEPEVIEWKYFDPAFNRDRERAVVWLREFRVAGFLGLIPFELQKNELRAHCAWSCDWSVDPRHGSGMGLLLVKKARELYDGIFNLGGNENTRRIFPRLADSTVPQAGISLVLPLRVASVLPRLPAGMLRRLLSRQQICCLPLRWVRRSNPEVRIEPGLSAGVISAIEQASARVDGPIYDSAFLDWQFRRCPAIKCWSCYPGSDSAPRTAALVWRSQFSDAFWRFVFCGDTTDLETMKKVTGAMVSFVYSQGCVALFAIASHTQSGFLKLLRARGFLRHGSLSFYAMRGSCNTLPLEEFSTLSFLDADLSYRFEQDQRFQG